MLLLVGLGNPGPEHARNRHNVGFLAVDEIARRHGFGPWRRRFHGQVAEGRLGERRVFALKPETYMNRSGIAVSEAARFYKVPLADIVVLYDDLDLAPGKVRVKAGGGSAGHNGIKSVDAHIGAGYRRVRIGIGHPGDRERVLGWVLQDFAKADEAWLAPLLGAVAEAAPLLAASDDAGFMTRLALLYQRATAPDVTEGKD
jgi:PTH1 family peptidyl-tRNA hydrolase